MANFAFNGVKAIGTDVIQEKVDMTNKGLIPIENFERWLGFDVKPLVENGLLKATTDWKQLVKKDVSVHMIAIPTEKDGRPYDVILEDVIKKISTFKTEKEPPIVIIESTLTPGRTNEVVVPIFEKAGLKVGKDILIGVAPRRDWFISPEKSLKNLPRIIGGTTLETTRIMKDVLSIICDHLLPAPDHKHAEMIKSIENAYRHVEITLANQLSLAYPQIDMEEVLRLVGTKWNIGTYRPSFGTGGYCIPLSSQYVLLGAQNPEQLTILKSAIETDGKLP
jgi:nucleotide sugar dehydrogenase